MVDLHADTLLWPRELWRPSGTGAVDLPRLLAGRVGVQVFSVVSQVPLPMRMAGNRDRFDGLSLLAPAEHWPIATWRSPLARALHQAHKLEQAEQASGGRLVFVKTAAQLREVRARQERGERVVAALLSAEGAQAVGADLGNLARLEAAGFRMMAPTHFTDTEVGGSAHGRSHRGLTPFGFRWVEEMESRKLIIDVAHASRRTLLDVARSARRPILVSHTGVRGTCDSVRNLDDEELRAVAATGGVIGIGYFKPATCGSDIHAAARAIAYAARVVGAEHVALGSDWDGAVRTSIDASGTEELVQALVDQGLSEGQIRGILETNALGLLERLLP